MDENKAKDLGQLIRSRREQLGWSIRRLAREANLEFTTVKRIEDGSFKAPKPDKLAAIAKSLNLPLADIFTTVDYAVPDELPSFKPYLRTKYRTLPAEDVEAIERYARRLAKKHGIALDGPAPGEDES